MFPTDTNFESEFTFERSADPLPDEPPFHVLLLGDWSGDGVKKELNQRRLIEIDRDNFNEVLNKLNVRLEIDWQNSGGDKLNLQFSEIDDFHPDNLFRQVTLFSELREIRRRLGNPDTFNSAASEVRSWFKRSEIEKPAEEIQADINDAPPTESDNLLDMILTEPRHATSPQTVDKTELGRFVSQIVSPHLIKVDEAEQSTLISNVDETISEIMRAILHHPKFQALESAWRGLYFIARRIETNSQLKIFILDISKDELTNDLKSVANLADSFLYRRLVSESSEYDGSPSFSAVGGDFDFGVNVEDIALLMRIGKICASADAPLFSYIKPEMFGLEKFSEKYDLDSSTGFRDPSQEKLWLALRSAPEANYIGLSPMKIFARMPYGENGDSVETFSFEEFTHKTENYNFLRFNPCFVSVLLLAQSYRQNGWQMGKRLLREVEKLPLYFFQSDEETRSAPVSEITLTEKMLEKILEQGLIPLVSPRNSDQLRIWRFQSISLNTPDLNGKWFL